MKISQLIENLQIMQENLGDVQCCQYIQDWQNKEVLSTIETVDVKPFKKKFVVLLDYRTL